MSRLIVVTVAIIGSCSLAVDRDNIDLAEGMDAATAAPSEEPTSSERLPCWPCSELERYDYHGPGTYRVPSPKGRDFGTAGISQVAEAHLRVRGAVVHLDYDLPHSLTGVVQELEFEGPLPAEGQPMQLSGPSGTAVCAIEPAVESGSKLFCFEQLPGAVTDIRALTDSMRALGASQQSIDAQLQVTNYFIEDPIGILEASLNP